MNHYGTGSEDPLKVVRFYNPDNEDVSFQASDETRRIYPQCFQERYLRLYCKDNRKLESAKATFQAFCKNFGLTVQVRARRKRRLKVSSERRRSGRMGAHRV